MIAHYRCERGPEGSEAQPSRRSGSKCSTAAAMDFSPSPWTKRSPGRAGRPSRGPSSASADLVLGGGKKATSRPLSSLSVGIGMNCETASGDDTTSYGPSGVTVMTAQQNAVRRASVRAELRPPSGYCTGAKKAATSPLSQSVSDSMDTHRPSCLTVSCFAPPRLASATISSIISSTSNWPLRKNQSGCCLKTVIASSALEGPFAKALVRGAWGSVSDTDGSFIDECIELREESRWYEEL